MFASGSSSSSSSSNNKKMDFQRSVKKVSLGRMFLNVGLCLCLLALTLGALNKVPVVECQEQVTVESRQQKDAEELNDTIKYLEKLDKYFSQIARPRFGRSQYKQPAGMMDRHQQQDPTSAMINGQLMGRPMDSQARLTSLIDLINNRLARRYSELNY